MHEREIVRELRLRLREYFPSLQSYIDQDIAKDRTEYKIAEVGEISSTLLSTIKTPAL